MSNLPVAAPTHEICCGSTRTGSDFGLGFLYCLMLFAEHLGAYLRIREMHDRVGSQLGPMMWFNAAADHLFELQIPERMRGTPLGGGIAAFRERCLHLRCHPDASEADVEWAKRELGELLMQIDLVIFGVETCRATWE